VLLEPLEVLEPLELLAVEALPLSLLLEPLSLLDELVPSLFDDESPSFDVFDELSFDPFFDERLSVL